MRCASNTRCRYAMCRRFTRFPAALANRAAIQGLGLVSAIALIMVVAVIMVAITGMVQNSSKGFTQDILSHRALLAAESGSQLGLNRLFPPQGAGACTNQTWDLSGFGLPSCQANVVCRAEVVDSTTYYTLESDGRCVAGQDIAERSVLVRVR